MPLVLYMRNRRLFSRVGKIQADKATQEMTRIGSRRTASYTGYPRRGGGGGGGGRLVQVKIQQGFVLFPHVLPDYIAQWDKMIMMNH